MAEAFALAASIIAVVQIADRIATISKSLIETVQDYPKDLRLFYIETGSLKVIFESLHFLKHDDPADSALLQRLRGDDGPIQGCKAAIEQLDRLFPSLPLPTAKGKGTKRIKMQTVLVSLAWPLKADKARKLLDEIMVHKSTINMALQGHLLTEVRSMKHKLDEVHVTSNDSEKRKVYEWYQDTNPSSSHNTAIALYEDKTGDWIFRMPDWDPWMNVNSRVRALWIYGIPGSGKTILAANIIKRTLRICEANDKRTTCVYYYCYHGHNQDESIPLLRWLVSQLLRQADTVPACAWKAYTKDIEPDTILLLDILHAILESFDLVYVAIDALDESQQRHNLLRVVNVLVTHPRFRKIQLLATSREYADIELTMDGISQSISMTNPFVEEDIRVYVTAKLMAEAKFQRWPSDLRHDVTEALSTGARGMFRWAVCQLDILRRLNHQSKIRQAIKCLPKTLDETYERIFSYIPDEEKEFVQYSLHWICFHDLLWQGRVPLSAKLLMDAYIASSTGKGELTSEEYVLDLETLKESCGCLVSFTFDQDGHSKLVNVAHYTVREFLESDRSSVASWFKIKQKMSYGSILDFILEYTITSEPFEIPIVEDLDIYCSPLDLRSTSTLQEYCLAASVRSLQHLEEFIEPKLAFRLLNPLEPHYDSLRETFFLFSNTNFPGWWVELYTVGFWDIDWRESTKSSKIPILAHLLLMECYGLAKAFFQELDIQGALRQPLFGSLNAKRVWPEDPDSLNEFGCDLVQFLAKIRVFDKAMLDFFEQEAPGLVSYVNILPHYMTGHSHHLDYDLVCDRSCVLTRLLRSRR